MNSRFKRFIPYRKIRKHMNVLKIRDKYHLEVYFILGVITLVLNSVSFPGRYVHRKPTKPIGTFGAT